MAAKPDLRTTDTKERVLKEAYRLFQLGGYNHMGLDQIAGSLHITRAALYHHFPGGKEELFAEMVQAVTGEKARRFRHIIEAYPDAQSRFRAMLLSAVEQPMLDPRQLSCAASDYLGDKSNLVLRNSFEALQQLVKQVFQEGIERGEIRPLDLNVAFFSFISLSRQIEEITEIPQHLPVDDAACHMPLNPEQLIDQLLDLWLHGVAV